MRARREGLVAEQCGGWPAAGLPETKKTKMAAGQIRFGIPFWGRCTTQFRTYFRGDRDVHRGYGILTHGQKRMPLHLPPFSTSSIPSG